MSCDNSPVAVTTKSQYAETTKKLHKLAIVGGQVGKVEVLRSAQGSLLLLPMIDAAGVGDHSD